MAVVVAAVGDAERLEVRDRVVGLQPSRSSNAECSWPGSPRDVHSSSEYGS